MEKYAVVGMLLIAAACLGQERIPAGTILPVQLNSSLNAEKVRLGEKVSGRVMQDVPLEQGGKIPAGAKVLGEIREVDRRNGSAQGPAEIMVRFDTLAMGKEKIPVTTNLRALGSMMDVEEAQVPETGPDRGTPESWWVTRQIGGETAYRGGPVTNGMNVVGKADESGVLVRVSRTAGCRGALGNDREQALWVFSSDACGLYGFRELKLVHAGRTNPVGQIVLRSVSGNVNVRAGSGMLLRVDK